MEEVETTKSSASLDSSGETLHSASAQSEVSADKDTSIFADSASLQEKSEEEGMEEASSPVFVEDGAALGMPSISIPHSEKPMDGQERQSGIAPKSVNSVDATTQKSSPAEQIDCQFQNAHQRMQTDIGLMESSGKSSTSESVEFLGINVGDAEERKELPVFADAALLPSAILPVVDESPENGEILFSIAHPANCVLRCHHAALRMGQW